jgi:hypothetical protein
MVRTSKHEKLQAGNPHTLTIKQHVFPSASIARFVGRNGCVDLCDIPRRLVRAATAGDVTFCAKRAWDQRAETGYMKLIEDTFQDLANRIIAGPGLVIGDQEKRTINEFFALWYMRSRHRNMDAQEIQANGVTGTNHTKDVEEKLEKNGYMFSRQGGRVPARQLNGLMLQLWTFRYANNHLPAARWGVIQADDGEFVVPDVPLQTVVPLTPTLCLVSPAPNGIIPKQNVAEINRNVMETSQEYFFARDFWKCPAWLRSRRERFPPPL